MRANVTSKGILRQPRWVAAATLALVLGGCATETKSPPASAPAAANAPRAKPVAKGLSINTPISTVAANPAGKAVLDHDLPGLLQRPEYGMFKTMSLKSLAGLSNGKITPATLNQVQRDLQNISQGDPP
jgi:hypothetical protein